MIYHSFIPEPSSLTDHGTLFGVDLCDAARFGKCNIYR